MHGCTTTTAVPFPFRFPRNRGVMEKASCNVEMRRGREKQQKKHPVEQPLVWGISSPEVSYRVAIVFRFGFVCSIPCLRYRINKSKQWLGAAKKHKREPSNSFQSSAMLKNIHDRWWSSLRHSLITKSKLHENVNCVCKELCFTLVVLPPFGRLFFFFQTSNTFSYCGKPWCSFPACNLHCWSKPFKSNWFAVKFVTTLRLVSSAARQRGQEGSQPSYVWQRVMSAKTVRHGYCALGKKAKTQWRRGRKKRCLKRELLKDMQWSVEHYYVMLWCFWMPAGRGWFCLNCR